MTVGKKWAGNSWSALWLAIAMALTSSAALPAEPGAVQPSGHAFSGHFGIDTGAAERIEAGDLLRTLSQEIPAAAYHLHNEVEPEESLRLMTEAKLKFVQLLHALEHGDPSMNIFGAEKKRGVLEDIEALKAHWEPMIAELKDLVADHGNDDAFQHVLEENDELFELSAHLLAMLEAEYTNPVELMQLDAIMLDIAGCQEMLTQQILKEACEIWAGDHSEVHINQLNESISRFEMGTKALHDGMPELGIIPAPTPEIKVGLEEVVADWSEIKVLLNAVLDYSIDDKGKVELFDRLNEKMVKMEKIVHLYVVYSKHNS